MRQNNGNDATLEDNAKRRSRGDKDVVKSLDTGTIDVNFLQQRYLPSVKRMISYDKLANYLKLTALAGRESPSVHPAESENKMSTIALKLTG